MESARISSRSHRVLMSGLSFWIGLGVMPALTAAQEPPVCQCMDLVFLQDVTGSMSSLDDVRNELQQILDLAEAGGLETGTQLVF